MKPVYSTSDRATEDLKAHGIGTSEDELIRFLQEGLPRTTGLPKRPVEKSQLIIDAMAMLANMESRAAVPVITKIARFDTSIGAFRVIEMDVEKTSPQARDDFRVRAYRLIQYNAINALGLIGDPQSANLIRSILQQEQAAGAQIQYSLCLASLGDPSGINYLVKLIELQNRRESAAAAKAFYYITGQDFGFTENSPIRARQQLSSRDAQWWNQNRGTFRVDVNAVRERRLNPKSHDIYAARSTRDLLKLAANYFDFNNTLGSRDARKQISSAGSSLNKEFERLALNEMEDLDVRIEAMNWYFEANRSDPLDILKKLRRDENPEIVDKANTLIDQIADEARMRGN
jgi:HEAT repeat protein